MIQEIAEYVENNIASLTLGENLFAPWRPLEIPDPPPDSYTVMQDTTSGGADFHVPFLSENTVNVFSFSKNDTIGANKTAMEIYDLIKQLNQVTLPVISPPVGIGKELKVAISHAKKKPEYQGQDEKGFHIYSFACMFKIEDLQEV